MMQSPFEPALVDAVLAHSLRRSLSVELLQSADPPFVAESLAVQYLKRRVRPSLVQSNGSVMLVAGFRLAVILCSRILADPLHINSSGVRRDVERVIRWLTDSIELSSHLEIED